MGMGRGWAAVLNMGHTWVGWTQTGGGDMLGLGTGELALP